MAAKANWGTKRENVMATEDTCNINTNEKKTTLCIYPSEAHTTSNINDLAKKLSQFLLEKLRWESVSFIWSVLDFSGCWCFLESSLHRGITGWSKHENWYCPNPAWSAGELPLSRECDWDYCFSELQNTGSGGVAQLFPSANEEHAVVQNFI